MQDEILSVEEVRKVALLARLALSPEEEQKYARQLGQILGYVRELQKVPIDGVEPLTHAVPLTSAERPDVTRPSLTRDEALRNAPLRVGEGLAVPKIIE